MSELEITKIHLAKELQRLCAHCVNNLEHVCPVSELTGKILGLSGVPLIVNDEFRGLLWT